MKYAKRYAVAVIVTLGLSTSCNQVVLPGSNPFTNLTPLNFNGLRQRIVSEVSPLGSFAVGTVLSINVDSDKGDGVYILRLDEGRNDAGVIINGGLIGQTFMHRVNQAGPLFLFLDAPADAIAGATLGFGNASYQKPPGQNIVVEFETDFLADGLFDPATNTQADRDFLSSIEPTVQDGVLDRLLEIFAGTGVTIIGPNEARPAEFSLLTISGQRVLGEGLDGLPVSGCDDIVLFGEVLPRGTKVDPGNQNQTDSAAVYTGSFRGTGTCDPGLVVNSTNNIINALALGGAHEVGHLMGLNHTALDGLMSATPSFAIQRQLSFQRSQIALDQGQGLQVFTSVIQDPAIYFENVFSGE
jgi:hypothetical protein